VAKDGDPECVLWHSLASVALSLFLSHLLSIYCKIFFFSAHFFQPELNPGEFFKKFSQIFQLNRSVPLKSSAASFQMDLAGVALISTIVLAVAILILVYTYSLPTDQVPDVPDLVSSDSETDDDDLRNEPPPPPPQNPDHEPEYDDDGALGQEFGGSGKATNAAYNDEDEGFTFDPNHPENNLQQPAEPQRKKHKAFAAFLPVPKRVQPELTAAQQADLDKKFETHRREADEQKSARAALLASVKVKWGLQQVKVKWGRKSREQLFQEALLKKVTDMIDAGAEIGDFGDKPVQPPSFQSGDEVKLPTEGRDEEEDKKQVVKEEDEDVKVESKKRGPYAKRSDDVKYLFWDLHRDLKHTSVGQTVEYVNTNLTSTFSGPLSIKTVNGSRKQTGWQEFKQRPVAMPAEPAKQGPKKRKLPTGEFKPWNNKRVSVSILMTLATMLMALVSAGVPLTTSTALSLALGLFANHHIAWAPKKGWAYTFMLRLGLKPRRGTRAARSLPPDFEKVKSLYILRVVYLVATFSILPWLFFNLDETGVRFMPLKDRTWAAEGVSQVDISNLGDKRLFTSVPVVDAIGDLVYTQVIWQGKTTASCPSAALQTEHQDVLAHTVSATHWSTPATMELLVDNLWNNHVKPKMLERYMDVANTYWAIAWDVYTSHRDQGLLARLRQKYPKLIILFVPASCTSELQPLDVGFNYDFKAFITALACAWLSTQVTKQLEENVAPKDIKVPHKKTELVAPFCSWVAGACRKMKSPEKVAATKRAWEKTGVSIAWEYDNTRRGELLAEAKTMNDAGTLFSTHSERRSKAGKVPRTLLVVAGAVDMKDAVEPAEAEEDEKVEEPEDAVVLDPAQEQEQEKEEAEDEEEQLPAPVVTDIKTRAGRSSKMPAKYRQ